MSARRGVHFGPDSPSLNDAGTSSNPLEHTSSPAPLNRGDSHDSKKLQRRGSSKYEDREQAAAYYDSRAATKREFKRRASTLQEYYKENPSLLPQLPFTWKHGWKRWKLFGYIGLIFVDACAIPIILYYTMRFIGNVEGWISMSCLPIPRAQLLIFRSLCCCRHYMGWPNLRRVCCTVVAVDQKGGLLPASRYQKSLGIRLCSLSFIFCHWSRHRVSDHRISTSYCLAPYSLTTRTGTSSRPWSGHSMGTGVPRVPMESTIPSQLD